jgi:hypothetical protein
MRVFVLACLVAVVVAATAAIILNSFVQRSAKVAFTEQSVRI